jgi:hypothetical protein
MHCDARRGVRLSAAQQRWLGSLMSEGGGSGRPQESSLPLPTEEDIAGVNAPPSTSGNLGIVTVVCMGRLCNIRSDWVVVVVCMFCCRSLACLCQCAVNSSENAESGLQHCEHHSELDCKEESPG